MIEVNRWTILFKGVRFLRRGNAKWYNSYFADFIVKLKSRLSGFLVYFGIELWRTLFTIIIDLRRWKEYYYGKDKI